MQRSNCGPAGSAGLTAYLGGGASRVPASVFGVGVEMNYGEVPVPRGTWRRELSGEYYRSAGGVPALQVGASWCLLHFCLGSHCPMYRDGIGTGCLATAYCILGEPLHSRYPLYAQIAGEAEY